MSKIVKSMAAASPWRRRQRRHFLLPASAEAQTRLATPGEVLGLFTGKTKLYDPFSKGITPDSKVVRTRKPAGPIGTGFKAPSAGLPKSPNAKPDGYTAPSAGLPPRVRPSAGDGNATGPVPPRYPNYGHGKPGEFDNGQRPGQRGGHPQSAGQAPRGQAPELMLVDEISS